MPALDKSLWPSMDITVDPPQVSSPPHVAKGQREHRHDHTHLYSQKWNLSNERYEKGIFLQAASFSRML